MGETYHIHGVLVETGESVDLWVADGRVSFDPVVGARTLVSDGFILPGLVDAHCHVGLAAQGAVDRATAEAQALTDLACGVTLIRDAGSPINTHWLDDTPGMPRIIRAGRHIARPRRYLKGFGLEIEVEDLVEEVRRQAGAGDGWVKLVGDWIDRDLGDLTPLWPADLAAQAIAAAHQVGVRVTAHCFAEESVKQLVRAGIDCIEHGTGLDGETIAEMVRRGTALVPTLDNINIFPGIAEQADQRYPRYAAHMRHLYARRDQVVRDAVEAGVAIYAGSDAGGLRSHGTILAEVRALAGVVGADLALGAVSWRARPWLGAANLDDGTPADLVVATADPRQDVSALGELSLIMVGGMPINH